MENKTKQHSHITPIMYLTWKKQGKVSFSDGKLMTTKQQFEHFNLIVHCTVAFSAGDQTQPKQFSQS